MSKIEVVGSGTSLSVKMSDIQIGTAFWGSVRGWRDGKRYLFLCTYVCIVKLDEPDKTWNRESTAIVDQYESVDLVITAKPRGL